MNSVYTPEAGHIICFCSTPVARQSTFQQIALVVSPLHYNSTTGLMLCCPITAEANAYPFEVRIVGKVEGVVLADHVKNVDWRVKNANYHSNVSTMELAEVRAKIRAIVGSENE